MRIKLAILFVLTFSAFVAIYLHAPDEFSRYDLLFLLFIIASVIAVETGGLALVHELVRIPSIDSFVAAAASVFNIYCLRLSLSSDFVVLSKFLSVPLLGMIMFILFVMFEFASEGGRRAWAILIVVALLPLVDAWPILLDLVTPVEKRVLAANGSGTASPNVHLVNFRTKPNVYIVGFDSLIPRSLATKYFGGHRFAYLDVLDDRFRAFRNMFADNVPTKSSLNSLLALDYQYYSLLKKEGANFRLFQGLVPSPLFQIFKHNGYESHTLFYNHYFGTRRGVYVDNYHYQKGFLVCQFIDGQVRVLAFFGYCRLLESNFGKALKKRWFGKFSSPLHYLLAQIKRAMASRRITGTPQIFVSYIYYPGHTDQLYRHSNPKKRAAYANQFAEKSVGTAEMIRTLTDFIQQNDKNAILLVFGDHGPWLSRGMTLAQDPTFFIQDRYGIYGGLFPPQVCQATMEQEVKRGFTTIMSVTRRLIQCLADGQDPLTVMPNDNLLQKWSSHQKPIRYEDYLYE